MKAIANREGLLTACQVCSSVVNPRSPKEILKNLKLSADGESPAILMATDLDLGIRYRVSGFVVETPGTLVLPAASLISILREMPDETIKIDATDSGIRISGTGSRFELNSSDPLEYPEVPNFGEGPVQEIKSDALSLMIKRTIFAIAPENSRYSLNSVFLEFTDGEGRMVATDGKRLALMPGAAKLSSEPPTGQTLVPPKALALLQKTLLDPEEMIELAIHPNEIHFRTAKVVVYSRLSEGRFPRYQDVFPAQPRYRVALGVGQLASVLRQAKIVTRDESKGVDFHFGDGSLTLRSRGADVGESEIRLPIAFDEEPVEITFDPQLFLDCLRVLDPNEDVSLEMIDPRKAAVLRSRDRFAYVVMPLSRERGS